MILDLYVDTKLASASPGADSTSPCQCQPPTKKFPFSCGDSCMNRALFTECGSDCPNIDFCTNRRLSTYQWCKTLQIFDTGTHGKGVKTTQTIEKGALLCEYVGEVIDVDTFWERMKTWYSECTMHYALQLDSNCVIDAYRCGSLAR